VGAQGTLVDYLTHLADLGNTGLAFDLANYQQDLQPSRGLVSTPASPGCGAMRRTGKKRMRPV
jgi:hypothetical protein